MDLMERDQTWAAMFTVAERMTAEHCAGDTLKIYAVTRRPNPVTVVQGLLVADNWTDVFEPVRKRRVFGKRWTEVQPVDVAAANVGAFLRERPDQS
jgi:hypothetical protein